MAGEYILYICGSFWENYTVQFVSYTYAWQF